MKDVIPESVFRAIQVHLRQRTAFAERGWPAGEYDEDTLTGDFGASLRTPDWIDSKQDGVHYQWRVIYKKTRGKGTEAAEKRTGADGVFQVEVQPHNDSLLVYYKGILFQAKKHAGSSRSDLIHQVENMEQIAPGGSALFEFGPEGYRGAAGRVILADKERNPTRIPHPDEPLGNFLADQFLPCGAGLRGMYYDFAQKTLLVPQEGIVKRISLRNLIEVKVRRRKRER
jgi:hypothetical protein